MRSTRQRHTRPRQRKRSSTIDDNLMVVEDYRRRSTTLVRTGDAQKANQQRSSLVNLVCGAYAMITSVWGLVFPLTEALTVNEVGPQHYPQVFAIYLYTLSIIFMVYLLFTIFGNRHGKNPDEIPSEALHGSSSSIHAAGIEGAGIYIRIGGRVFGLGAMVFHGMRFAAHISEAYHNLSTSCDSVLFRLENLLQLIFTGIQMVFLYKCNKIVIRKQQQAARFFLTHVMVTNVRTWFNSLVHETVEDMASLEAQEHLLNITMDKDHLLMVSGGGHDESHDAHSFCHDGLFKLAHEAARFLIPCIIEYSIISAVVVYCIFANIGYHATEHDIAHAEKEEEFHLPKLTCGLVAGIVPVIFTVCSISVQFMYKDEPLSLSMFYATSHILFVFNTGAILMGFWATRHLRFHISDHGMLDIILLMISLVGNFCFQVFYLCASWPYLVVGDLDWLQPFLRALQGVLQPVFQTVFILEGLRKNANTPELVEQKPGRNIVLFVLCCNLSLWIVETFAASQIDRGRIMEIFGQQTWLIMFHLFIPFVIFYRFHSTACLAEICGEAYSEKNILKGQSH